MTLVKVNNPYAKSINGFVNDFFNEFPSGFGKTLREDVFGFPPVNIVEKADSYQLEVSVPGYDKADFNVKLDGNIITISAEKKEETKDETNKVIRKEFTHKSFKRSFTIDEKIEDANINAKYENGILNVTLPKKETVKPVSKDITIQ
jgi:HSP20 family protein